MSTQTTPFESLMTRSARSAGVATVAAIKAIARRWLSRAVTRRHLQQLPSHLYRDVGLRPDQVQCEVNRPFWQ